MPQPKDWRGSDGRARAEVVLWLKNHGEEVHDPAGLITGRIKADLNKGRALSQLLADMEKDGMIRREIHGRRTLSIKLLDDWHESLGRWYDDLQRQPEFRKPVNKTIREADTSEPDYDHLAAALLARVIKQAHTPASSGAQLEKLREQVAELKAQLAEARDAVIMARDSEAEQRRQADTMRESLAKLSGQKTKRDAGGVKLRDALSQKDQALLDRLMREVPSRR